MIIKKFTGKTEAEATEAAQKELGNGVVVMNVRQIKPKGFLAAIKPKLIEVTVAMEEEPDRSAYVKKEPTPARTAAPEASGAPASSGTRSIEEKLDNLQILLESQLRLRQQESRQAEEEKPDGTATAARREEGEPSGV